MPIFRKKLFKLPSLSVNRRLSLSIIVPLLGLLGFAALQVEESLSDVRSYSDMQTLMQHVSEINEITYMLQKERGEAFLFREGQSDKAALEKTYSDTDQSLKYMPTIIADIHKLGNEKADEALNAFQEGLQALPELRTNTVNEQMSSSGIISGYTDTISQALNIQRVAGRSTDSGNIALQAVALNQISMAKEFASNEQAVIDGAIAKEEITKFAFQEYQQLVLSQDILIDLFLSQQSAEVRPVYEDILKSREVVDIKKLRGRTDRAGAGGKIPAKKYADWHDVSDKRIEQLRNIETSQLTSIEDTAASLQSAANRSLMIWTTVSLSITLLTLVQAFILARSITRPLRGLTDSLLSLAEGNLETEVAGLNRRDELGLVASAVEKLKMAALEKVHLEATAEKSRQSSDAERRSNEELRAREAAELQHTVDVLGQGLGRLANGDLSVDISEPFKPEFERLRTDFNLAQEHLRSVLATVEMSADTIRDNAMEMRGSADELARRTEQQAASLEETAAALEEITTTVKVAAEGASDASSIAETAFGATKRSTSVVSDAIAAMSKIQGSSQKIGNIISVMDEIAFQTNLLALNAGVEAARAGEAGKGFAVVAQEVRELAGRSAAAAKEISALITASDGDVQVGVKLVEATGETLQEIEGFMQDINTRLTAIAGSAKEQSVGLAEINTSIGHMDQMTQQNAAMVEETTAATHTLNHEVEVLRDGLSGFVLGGGDERPIRSNAAA
ncbi:methyl-accepting chemotaxis protein [Rhizobium sp. L1K21]|uniref:methyl-accepting chemotaxis protein n=1 Tax=Rhizobium sp. L1K21 TaxID=2954933 RepID=UPI0020921570|nr:methyl-accepting chemotaxis protein [Rhizobium sp. L1K21]MCO6187021.1 methyl-accepting chemotaxis protein [Rhizobium sp. L1K21]